jgi:rhodanese-related sulfurtransferase
LGEQRESNYALKAESRDAFIKAVTEGLPEPQQYFPINAQINKEGYESLQHILDKGLRPLSPAEVELMNLADAILLDTRPPEVFTNGFVPGSINIGLDGRFAEWAGSLLPFDQPIVLITEKGREKETITRLARVGFQMLEGYLDGAVEAWKASGREIDLIVDIEADELAMDLPYDKNIVVLDVRRDVEYADGHLKAAVNLPLNEMTDPEAYSHFQEHQNLYLHCAGGYRSVIAASLLKRQGIHNLRNIVGGWKSISALSGKIEIVKDSSILN